MVGLGIIAVLDGMGALISIALGALCLALPFPTLQILGGVALGMGIIQIPLIIGYVKLNRTALTFRMGLALLQLLNPPMGTLFAIFVLITLGAAFDASYAQAYLQAKRRARRARPPARRRKVA
jgi:hypothetical protein